MENWRSGRIAGAARIDRRTAAGIAGSQSKSEAFFYVIGSGSNLLVADDGLAGTVIKLGGSLRGLQITDQTIVAEAGVPLPFLARKAAEHNLSGLEFAAGIPGTIGGAVVMNAGAYQSQMSDIVTGVTCCDAEGRAADAKHRTMRLFLPQQPI